MEDRDERRGPAPGTRTISRRLLSYALAGGLALGVYLARAVLQGRAGADHPTWLFLYFPIFFASARWLGLGPGLLSAGLATVLLAWEAPPSGSLWVESRGDREYVAMFG